MGSTKQAAFLAAGYLLGRTKTIKTLVLLAGGVAYGRMTAQRGKDDGSSGSILSKFSGSHELHRISSGLAEAARGAVAATATKGVESLNQNLQKRTAALREEDEATDQASEDSDEQQDAQETEQSEAESEEATKSGGR